MSKKKDLFNLGEAYADVFNKVITEDSVPPGQEGSAPLVAGGPEEKGGFRKPLVDITTMSDKDKKDNIYNIKGYTYGAGNDPGDCNEPQPTGPEFGQVPYSGVVGPEEDEEGIDPKADLNDDGELSSYEKKRGKAIQNSMAKGKKGKKQKEAEEDEEFLEEHEKIARDGLNNFMSKTSVFDKLYNKVMVNENFGEDAEDVTELEALGIETETDVEVDDVPEEITVSIPGELAQSLCDILQTALAQQEVEVDVDVDVEEVTDTEFEEDEEAAMKDGGGYGIDAGSTLKHDVNMGHGSRNKVSNLKPTGAAKDKDGGGYGVDAGSTLNHTVNMGKNNKVGKLPVGKNAFEG
tara:strand:- start:3876 stop:4922 length:1047 start_codon:yes stop_codon:yes gene_type:complete